MLQQQRLNNRGEKYVIGPTGTPLTLNDLPPANTQRWVIRRKAEVVAAVRGGLLTLDDACERYRLEHGSWPTSWGQLTSQYLKEIPLDPFTGRALLFKALPDGLVIYSVGYDGKDDGGDVIRAERPTRDIGYRLWDPSQRGINLDENYNEELKKMKQE